MEPLAVPTCPARLTPFSALCLPDAPLFLSHPHFYNADPVLAESVLGLHPNEKDHSLFLDIHPVSPSSRQPVGVSLVHRCPPSPRHQAGVGRLVGSLARLGWMASGISHRQRSLLCSGSIGQELYDQGNSVWEKAIRQ